MSTAAKRHTVVEYLALERHSEVKHEFLDGELFAMAGSSEAHNLIVGNLVRELGNRLLEGPCKVYPSDMRVKVNQTGLYTYPDVSAVCSGAVFEDERRDTLLNPQVIFEVLSPSTEAYDRGKKFQYYSRIESLTAYLLVSQTSARVASYVRQADRQWLLTMFDRLDDSIVLPALGCELPLASLYKKVDLA